ncbi:MAG: ABC transporter ATP-binding protein [Tissierellales bacterium]|jgi:ABC-2 type transport system ATP-binding protein|nr:ABC transporter ATP-binding protein [Tissierellales bacterium]
MLEIINASKWYKEKGTLLKANDSISLKIERNDVVGFLGPNGAGKTTLVKSICRLIELDEGEILLQGENISEKPIIANNKIGVQLEGSRNLYNFLTVRENLKYFSLLNNSNPTEFNAKLEEYCEFFGILNKLDTSVNKLSRGMNQKVSIINILLKDPEIIILDEPTLGLDITSKIKMIELLKKFNKVYKKTVIMCSHDIGVVEALCNKVAVFNNGQLLKYEEISEIKYNRNTEKIRALIRIDDMDVELINNPDITVVSVDRPIMEVLCNNSSSLFKEFNEANILEFSKIDLDLNEYIKDVINCEDK